MTDVTSAVPTSPGEEATVIAEVGVNHDGDVDRAHMMIDIARDAGADVVKFQTFDPDLVASPQAPAADYQRARAGASTQNELLRQLVLPQEAWSELSSHAAEAGLRFMSTAFDVGSLELLLQLELDALKIPSGELTNLPFIGRCAEADLPMIVSTGMGTWDEVAAALDAIGDATRVTLLHCVTAYPAPLEQSNLRAIPAMAAAFDVPVGWSDHTVGSRSAVIAVALGASVLEKHLTYDRTAEGPDHAASADPVGFAAYVEAVRSTEGALGDGVKAPAPAEVPNMRAARRSYFLARDLESGRVLSEIDLVLLRPEVGMGPSDGSPVGRRLRRAKQAGSSLAESDLE